MADDSLTTLRNRHVDAPGRESRLMLTIAFHPDPDRVGESCELSASDTVIGRNAPLFRGADGELRPLADRFISREAITLHGRGEDILLLCATTNTVVVDEVPVQRRRTLTSSALERGVVINLSERLVLFLHEAHPPAEQGDDLGLVGADPAIESVRVAIRRCADLPVAVLIRGESGTGKELVARAIHQASRRAHQPFVSVNMGAVPEATAASELFGHGKGAFTGASSSHSGYFAEAEGGTLFLDEIGATPAAVQPMLLRVLESQEIQPLGAGAPRRVDVRLIAATDADLEAAVATDSFRSALLHRLEGFQLSVPPLRARRSDIGRLLFHFLRTELALTGDLTRLRTKPEAPTWIPAGLVAGMLRSEWPGNVRQLRNVVRQLAVSNRGADSITLDQTLEQLLQRARGSVAPPAPPHAPIEPGPDVHAITDDDIVSAMAACRYVVNDAAKALGVSRSFLYARVKRIDRLLSATDLTAAEIESAQSECGGDLQRTAQHIGVSLRALKRRMSELGLA